MIPDKLYISQLIYGTWQYQTPDPDDENQVEYIRKDTLLEWAKKELSIRRDSGDSDFLPAIVVLDDLIEKLNSM